MEKFFNIIEGIEVEVSLKIFNLYEGYSKHVDGQRTYYWLGLAVCSEDLYKNELNRFQNESFLRSKLNEL